MFRTDAWLMIINAMVVNAVLFGIGLLTVLLVPALAAHSRLLIPAIVAGSFILSPLLAILVSRRMRIRNWGRAAWQRGDAISG